MHKDPSLFDEVEQVQDPMTDLSERLDPLDDAEAFRDALAGE